MNELNTVDIVLIEDNPNDAELALLALKKKGLANRVLWFKDGAEAMDFFFANGSSGKKTPGHPKVVLLDLKMPKVDGLEILRQLKGNDHTKSIPVVVMTSSQEEKDIVESYRLGVNSYLVKPVDFDKFAESVSEMGFYWVLLNKVPT